MADGLVRKLVRELGEVFLADSVARFTALLSSGVLVVRNLIRRLDLHYRKLFKVGDYDLLRFQVTSGQVSPAVLLKEGIAAAAAGRRETFVEQLRQAGQAP